MFGKNEQSSEEEVNEILNQFGISEISDEEKEALIGLAKNRVLNKLQVGTAGTPEFMKTTTCQNWMILRELQRLNQNIEKLLNK